MLLLDYLVKTSYIDNGKGIINSTLVEIYKGENKIGEYKRNYCAYSKSTFFAFSHRGKDYALYSPHYEDIRLMSLPSCEEIILSDECKKQMEHFCPVEIHVPIYDACFHEHNGKTTIDQYSVNSIEIKDKREHKFGYCEIATALGCIWGDDTSFKLILIDLRNIENGEIWFINNELERKWLYEEFPDKCELKDMEFIFDYDDDEKIYTFPSAYKQLIQTYQNLG